MSFKLQAAVLPHPNGKQMVVKWIMFNKVLTGSQVAPLLTGNGYTLVWGENVRLTLMGVVHLWMSMGGLQIRTFKLVDIDGGRNGKGNGLASFKVPFIIPK